MSTRISVGLHWDGTECYSDDTPDVCTSHGPRERAIVGVTAGTCPGSGQRGRTGRRGTVDDGEPCGVCGARTYVKIDGTLSKHRISARRAAEINARRGA